MSLRFLTHELRAIVEADIERSTDPTTEPEAAEYAKIEVPDSVKKADRPWFQKLVYWIKRAQEKGRRPALGTALRLDALAGSIPMDPKKLYGLFMRYPDEMAKALGYSKGRYEKSHTTTSGRGAFGHLGGSDRRSAYRSPTFYMEGTEDKSEVCNKLVDPRRGTTFGDNRCRGKVVYVDWQGRGWCKRHEPDAETKATWDKIGAVEKKKGRAEATEDNPYGTRCPVCDEPARGSCRCMIGEKTCENGHTWVRCPVHEVEIDITEEKERTNTHAKGSRFVLGECWCPQTESAEEEHPVGREHAVLVRKKPDGTSIWKWILKYAYPRSGNAHNPTPEWTWELRDANGKVIDSASKLRDIGK